MNDLYQLLLDNQSNIDKAKLVQLATTDDSSSLVNDLMSKDIPTQLKAFMLASAKSELMRVIKLTDALNKLEDTYIRRALEDQDSMDMKSLSNTINVIINSLNRSMELINRVTTDDNLKVIIDQSTKIYNHNNTVSVLSDKYSRDKLRVIAAKLLSSIEKDQSKVVNFEPIVVDTDAKEVDHEQ